MKPINWLVRNLIELVIAGLFLAAILVMVLFTCRGFGLVSWGLK